MFINDVKRKMLKNDVFSTCKKYGNVVEEDDKIVCYINKNKLKIENDKYFVDLWLSNYYDKTSRFYFGKPFYFEMKDIEIKDCEFVISGHYNCNFLINNCKFDKGLIIVGNYNNLIFNNVSITEDKEFYLKANNILFNNVTLKNKFTYVKNDLLVFIQANDGLIMNEVSFGNQNKCNSLLLISNDLNIKNSRIESDYLLIKSNNFNIDRESNVKVNDRAELVSMDTHSLNRVLLKSENGEAIKIGLSKSFYIKENDKSLKKSKF